MHDRSAHLMHVRAATGQQFSGEVLAHRRAGSDASSSSAAGQLLVLYDDGEDEWIDPPAGA